MYVWSTAAAKSLQSCPTLCDPRDGSPPGSPDPGILQARTLEWVAISFSNACKWKVKVKSLSRVRLWTTPWTATHQAPPSMGFSRQEYWSGVPLPSPVWSTIGVKRGNSERVYTHKACESSFAQQTAAVLHWALRTQKRQDRVPALEMLKILAQETDVCIRYPIREW